MFDPPTDPPPPPDPAASDPALSAPSNAPAGSPRATDPTQAPTADELDTLDRLATLLLDRVRAVIEDARARAVASPRGALELGAGEIDLVTACEEVVRIAQGVQLDAVQLLDARRRSAPELVRDESVFTRSLFVEIALARQVSSPAGETTYAMARALEVLPQTHGLLRDGTISSGVAAAVCRETTFLAADDRRRVDAEIAPALADLTPRRAAAEARRLVLATDPHAAYARTVRAREGRAVTFRPELDAMASLTVYAPADQVVAAFEHLDGRASVRRNDGDPRTIRQLTADLAIEALTGAQVAADGSHTIGVEVGVVMRPESLFSADAAPATLSGYGPIPAELARQLAGSEHSWVRRFFTAPDGRSINDVDPRARRFSRAVRRIVQVVDGQCRRPWCDCRIRDVDHITPYARGGLSVVSNAQGDCRTDNLAKESPGWEVTSVTSANDTLPDEVHWRTPTGHVHVSRRSEGRSTTAPDPTRGHTRPPEPPDRPLPPDPTRGHTRPPEPPDQPTPPDPTRGQTRPPEPP
ncbi:HNH endonuclease signature motif containing protein, partial [Mumia xiangluensis]